MRGDSSLLETEKSKAKTKFWPHNLQISTDCVPHMEKVFAIVRHRYGLSPKDKMKDIAIWSIFMSATLQAAGQIGKDYTENL